MNHLLELLELKRVSQKELSIHLKVSHATVSNWAAGRYEMSDEMARAIGEYFSVSPAYVKGLSDDPMIDSPKFKVTESDLVKNLQIVSKLYAEGSLTNEEFFQAKKMILGN